MSKCKVGSRAGACLLRLAPPTALIIRYIMLSMPAKNCANKIAASPRNFIVTIFAVTVSGFHFVSVPSRQLAFLHYVQSCQLPRWCHCQKWQPSTYLNIISLIMRRGAQGLAAIGRHLPGYRVGYLQVYYLTSTRRPESTKCGCLTVGRSTWNVGWAYVPRGTFSYLYTLPVDTSTAVVIPKPLIYFKMTIKAYTPINRAETLKSVVNSMKFQFDTAKVTASQCVDGMYRIDILVKLKDLPANYVKIVRDICVSGTIFLKFGPED